MHETEYPAEVADHVARTTGLPRPGELCNPSAIPVRDGDLAELIGLAVVGAVALDIVTGDQAATDRATALWHAYAQQLHEHNLLALWHSSRAQSDKIRRWARR